jgi:hypothetical protein
VIADRLDVVCTCGVGARECLLHPGRLRTQEEKVAFRKRWDARVDAGRRP